MRYKYSGSDYKEVHSVMIDNAGLDTSRFDIFPQDETGLIIDEKDISKLLQYHPEGLRLVRELEEYTPPQEEI